MHTSHELKLWWCSTFSHLWIWFIACRHITRLWLRISVLNGNLIWQASAADWIASNHLHFPFPGIVWTRQFCTGIMYTFSSLQNKRKFSQHNSRKKIKLKQITHEPSQKDGMDFQSILGTHYLISSITRQEKKNQHPIKKIYTSTHLLKLRG